MGPCNEVVFLGGVERWERSGTAGQGQAASRRGGPLLGAALAPGSPARRGLEGQAGAAQVLAAVGTACGAMGARVWAGDSRLVAFCHSPVRGVVRTG